MRLILFVAINLLFLAGTDALAGSPNAFYNKALEAAVSLEDEDKADSQIADVATEALFYLGDLTLAQVALSKIKHPIFKSEISAKIGKALAIAGNCKEANAFLGDAYAVGLKDDLLQKRPHYRAEIALSALVEGYAYCNSVDKAEEIALKHKPSSLKEKQYIANVYSTIGRIAHLKTDLGVSKTYFDKAFAIAFPIADETHRSDALRNIAVNQIDAGLYEQALNTALEIRPTAKPAIGMAARYSSFKNKVLLQLACHYLSEGDFKASDRILIQQSILDGNLYPACLVDFFVKEALSKPKEKASKALDVRYNSLKRHSKGREILKIAEAQASIGNRGRAEVILERLFNEKLSQYEQEAEDLSRPSPSIIWFIDDLIQEYVVISQNSEWAYTVLTLDTFKGLKPHQFKNAWGALIGLAEQKEDTQLRSKIEATLGDAISLSAIQYGTFLYYLDIDQLDMAEKVIEDMPPFERSGLYLILMKST